MIRSQAPLFKIGIISISLSALCATSQTTFYIRIYISAYPSFPESSTTTVLGRVCPTFPSNTCALPLRRLAIPGGAVAGICCVGMGADTDTCDGVVGRGTTWNGSDRLR